MQIQNFSPIMLEYVAQCSWLTLTTTKMQKQIQILTNTDQTNTNADQCNTNTNFQPDHTGVC